jgi:hypothetical protein
MWWMRTLILSDSCRVITMSSAKNIEEMNKLYNEAVAIIGQVHADGLARKPAVMEQVQAIVDSIPRVPPGMIKTLPAEEDSSSDESVKVIERPAETKTTPNKTQREKRRPPTPVEMEYAEDVKEEGKEKPAEGNQSNPTKRKLVYEDVVEETTPEPDGPPNLDETEKKQKTKDSVVGVAATIQSSDDMLTSAKSALFKEVKEQLQGKSTKKKSKKNQSAVRNEDTESSDDDEGLKRFKADSFKTPVRQPKPLIVPETPDNQDVKKAGEEKEADNQESEAHHLDSSGDDDDSEEGDIGAMVIRSRHSTLIMPRRSKPDILSSRVPKNGPVRKSRPAASVPIRDGSTDAPYDPESVFYGMDGLPKVEITRPKSSFCVPLYDYELYLIRLGLLSVDSASLFTRMHYTQDQERMDVECRACSNPDCFLFGHPISRACMHTMMLDIPSTVAFFCSSNYCGKFLEQSRYVGRHASEEQRQKLKDAYVYRFTLSVPRNIGIDGFNHPLATVVGGDTFADRGLDDYLRLMDLHVKYACRKLDGAKGLTAALTDPALKLCIRETALEIRIESLKIQISRLRSKRTEVKTGLRMMAGLISAHLDIMVEHASTLGGAEYQALSAQLTSLSTNARRGLDAHTELFILSMKEHGLAKICEKTKCRGPLAFFSRLEALSESDLKALASITPSAVQDMLRTSRSVRDHSMQYELPTTEQEFTPDERAWSARIKNSWN